MRPATVPCLLIAALALLAPSLSVAAADQASTTARLDQVRKEIRALAAAQRQAGGQRDALVEQLADQADALAAAARALARADAKLAEHRQSLAALEAQRAGLQDRLDGQRAALAELLRAAYTIGHGSDLRVLLGQLAPCREQTPCADNDLLGRLNRALAYSRYFQQDRLTRIRSIVADLSALDSVRQRIAAETIDLANARDAQQQHQATLQSQRRAQRALLAEVQRTIQQRGKQLETLNEEEKTLSALLQRLRNVFADIPRELAAERPFAERRGQLPWPLTGAAEPSNHGVQIDATPGTAVHAVAHGRVAYAAWLRGYGLLLIVDHGDGWMSLYGGNETLQHAVGDWVEAGEEIATSGRSETGKAGLYFGLRHDGKAVDPAPWLQARH
ncbi:MAG TPA: peptidoglycan DD-metalloendopeptidase family protein [Rhodanobacteraceae bacterium]|nr:peptidoglycan DD-metalloendopeptidase family protein [Rhodanobacteraceae bacterium]